MGGVQRRGVIHRIRRVVIDEAVGHGHRPNLDAAIHQAVARHMLQHLCREAAGGAFLDEEQHLVVFSEAADQTGVERLGEAQVGDAGRQAARLERVGGDVVGTVRCVLGPRDDWFGEAAVEQFFSTTFTVTGESNRVGLRLESDVPITRTRDGELPSEGMVAGSVQIPPNGQPVLFLRDHAVTGGYPVIATVINEDVDIAAQLPPGGKLRFERYPIAKD